MRLLGNYPSGMCYAEQVGKQTRGRKKHLSKEDFADAGKAKARLLRIGLGMSFWGQSVPPFPVYSERGFLTSTALSKKSTFGQGRKMCVCLCHHVSGASIHQHESS